MFSLEVGIGMGMGMSDGDANASVRVCWNLLCKKLKSFFLFYFVTYCFANNIKPP
jgi:hypothetical protein